MNQSQSPVSKTGLMTVRYADGAQGILLKTYADTLVYGAAGGKNRLCAIRFGGYPEQVNGMVQAIYGGGTVEIERGKEKLVLQPFVKQYRRKVSHDGVYAEAVLVAEDERQQAKDETKQKNLRKEDDYDSEKTELVLPPRNRFIYVAPGDNSALFDAIDRKTGVPMIPEFQEYILSELKQQGVLTPLTVLSSSQKFEAWLLKCTSGDGNIIEIVENGIKSGDITIPGAASVTLDPLSAAAETIEQNEAMASVNSVTEYLSAYGLNVAERIKNLFVPLFDPEKDELSPEVMEINGTIQGKVGYSLYDAQLAVAEAIKRQLARGKVALIIAECGAGKTKIGVTAIAAAVSGLQADQQRRKKSKTLGERQPDQRRAGRARGPYGQAEQGGLSQNQRL